LLALLLVATVFFLPSGGLRIVLGLPFVLLFSGYALMAALFPRKNRFDLVSRLVLSACGSVTVVPLLMLGLYYAGLGINLESILVALVAFCLVCSLTGELRWRRLAVEERFSLEINFPRMRPPLRPGDKVLTAGLVPLIIAAAVLLGYFVIGPGSTGVDVPFTEFYLMGADGQWGDYPRELRAGESGEITVGITNYEQRRVAYRVELSMGEEVLADTGFIDLAADGRWEETICFIPTVSGDDQRLDVLLYKDGEAEPSAESLHLWVDITD
jgi:uncharacterized membrane protein